MSRKILAAVVSLLIMCAGVYIYLSFTNGDPVYFRIIDEPTDALDTSRIEWTKEKDNQKGLHLYALDPSNPYELLVYDNTYRGLNRYRTSALSAKLFDQTLRIDITDKDAVDDSFVNDMILAYFIIKDKPAAIEVYRNGVLEQYKIESGTEQISK